MAVGQDYLCRRDKKTDFECVGKVAATAQGSDRQAWMPISYGYVSFGGSTVSNSNNTNVTSA